MTDTNGKSPKLEISSGDLDTLFSSVGFPQCLGLLTDLAKEQLKNVALSRALAASEAMVSELESTHK